MSYCTRDDLISRLSVNGLLQVADDDEDGVSDLAILDVAILSAAAEIDAALHPYIPLPFNGTNEWLRRRAVDLAVENLSERRGGDVPSSLARSAERSRQWLEQVRLGELRVPGLDYPSDRLPDEVRQAGLPRVANPDHCNRRLDP